MPFLKVLLWPFTILYNLITKLRNYLFDIGHKPSFEFQSIVISIGNLNVGGSGKTPMIEYLVRLLKDRYKLAIVSRGYGRKTKGLRIANESDNADTLGDEPYQYYRKYGKWVTICVAEERALAIPTILLQQPSTQVILLDDAFQHRTVIPQFSILLTELGKPFYQDYVLPFGRLRESRSGAKRADVIVVTKCKDLVSQQHIVDKIQHYSGDKPIFFSGMQYLKPVAFAAAHDIGKKVVLVSGVANSSSLEAYVSSHFTMVKHFQFADHYSYSSIDVKEIELYTKKHEVGAILTTEKDMVKLISSKLSACMNSGLWFYLPVETVFINRGSEFDEKIIHVIETKLEELNQ